MTINAKNSSNPTSATEGVVSSANTLGHGHAHPGTPGKTLPMTPQVKQCIAAVRSAYNNYQRSGGQKSIQTWLEPQIEEAIKDRETTSARTAQNIKLSEDTGIGTVLGILLDLVLKDTGPVGLILGAVIDGAIEEGGGSGGGGNGSGDGSHGDNPGGGQPT